MTLSDDLEKRKNVIGAELSSISYMLGRSRPNGDAREAEMLARQGVLQAQNAEINGELAILNP